MRWRRRDLHLRDALVIGLPAIALIVAGFWVTSKFIKPAPPRTLTIATGSEGGAYQMFAARYKSILERNGIELIEKPSKGALENLQWLRDPEVAVDVAFMQGGIGLGLESAGLASLGSFYYEPLWVFYRGDARLTDIIQLRGKRVAIGPQGSGTRKLAEDLLDANGITGAPTTLASLGGLAAVEALREGRVDAVFLVGPASSGAVWVALYTEGVRLMSFARADAYVRRLPFLAKLSLPHGAIDLVRDIPAREVTLIAPMATLVVREETHPALVDLLLQAATEVHGQPGLFQRAGEFPNARQVDFPLSPEAARFYSSGTRFLQRYLPFWAATLVDRLVVMLIPLFAILIPVVKLLPLVYGWRIRSRIYRWYGELKFLERDIAEDTGATARAEWLDRLDKLEASVNRIKTPNAFTNQFYVLREHINLVRRQVEARQG